MTRLKQCTVFCVFSTLFCSSISHAKKRQELSSKEIRDIAQNELKQIQKQNEQKKSASNAESLQTRYEIINTSAAKVNPEDRPRSFVSNSLSLSQGDLTGLLNMSGYQSIPLSQVGTIRKIGLASRFSIPTNSLRHGWGVNSELKIGYRQVRYLMTDAISIENADLSTWNVSSGAYYRYSFVSMFNNPVPFIESRARVGAFALIQRSAVSTLNANEFRPWLSLGMLLGASTKSERFFAGLSYDWNTAVQLSARQRESGVSPAPHEFGLELGLRL